MTNTLTVLYEQRMKRDFDKKKGSGVLSRWVLVELLLLL